MNDSLSRLLKTETETESLKCTGSEFHISGPLTDTHLLRISDLKFIRAKSFWFRKLYRRSFDTKVNCLRQDIGRRSCFSLNINSNICILCMSNTFNNLNSVNKTLLGALYLTLQISLIARF